MPRSILKNPHSAAPASEAPAVRSREVRNRETALYHADLLQQRKDVEALILESTETLIDVPSSTTADPACPSPSDAALVKNSIRSFQPSDYDALIEERNINRRCGYVLCPRPNRLKDTKAKYRILHGHGKGSDALKFVDKHSLEKWCSDDCGKRALYVKVQLNEQPAWTRSATTGGDVVLLEDGNDSQEQAGGTAALIEGMKNLDVGLGEEEMIAKMKALAIERGDGNAPSRSFGLAEVGIQEKNRDDSREPSPPSNSMSGDSIEGYRPRFLDNALTRKAQGLEQDDDIMGTI